MKQKYPKIEQIPQLGDHKNILKQKVCNTQKSVAVLSSDGTLIETADAYSYVVKTGKNYLENVTLSEKKKKWITFPYRDFKYLPKQFEKLPFYLKYGHIAKAYRLIQPYEKAESGNIKKIYDRAAELISAFEQNLLKDIDQLISEKKYDEAYRLTFKALTEFRGIRNDFTAKLKEAESKTRKDPSVRKLRKGQGVFMMAEQYFKKGKVDFAAKYLESIAQNTPDNYYGRRAKQILKYLQAWR